MLLKKYVYVIIVNFVQLVIFVLKLDGLKKILLTSLKKKELKEVNYFIREKLIELI